MINYEPELHHTVVEIGFFFEKLVYISVPAQDT